MGLSGMSHCVGNEPKVRWSKLCLHEEIITVEYDKSNLNIDYFDENDCQVKDSGRIKT